ncbi:redox-active disulfide protein 2 [Sediminibacterium goheungense]|uniref:Redox-active disulfide protein 2 n=1 Tax=Sediminibacterium goheungense TaxID=1086393 RepID=A0A4R6J1E8_9BACT|nr:redox-active disulfide protein 2 [Sediminibacterium goheungense]TDO28657.1 hypothetical protein BC659_0735 [Sediminibacterium goheungense]
MKSQPIAEMSTEVLKKNYKTMKMVIIILSVFLLIMVGSGVYITLTKGFGAVSILPIAFLPLFMLNMVNFKKIKKELTARGENLGDS